MTQDNEAYCLAVLINSLKRRERYPDPITVADCAKALYDMYNSYQQISGMVGVHASVIRKWINLAKAPEEMRQCVKEGKIYPVAAFAILSAFPEENKRVEVAKEVVGWGEPEIVRLIRYMKGHPNLSVTECKELLMTEAMNTLLRNGDGTNNADGSLQS